MESNGKKMVAAFSLFAVSGLAMRSQSLQANAFNANKDYKTKVCYNRIVYNSHKLEM